MVTTRQSGMREAFPLPSTAASATAAKLEGVQPPTAASYSDV
ncbi:unnamed protein product, partial [Gulo gulo]